MRSTDQIDDPTWEDIQDRDAKIERLHRKLENLSMATEQAGHDAARIARLVAEGHSDHCAKRILWGDNNCECGLVAGSIPTTMAGWAKTIHQYAKDKGWWDEPRSIGDIFMLFTSEVAEAYEEYRNGHEVNETYFNEDAPTKPEGVPTELADVIIRILDFCRHAGIDMQAVMAQKHRYNLTRPYRHGGKRV